MNKKILFDTSIWVDFFLGVKSDQTDLLTNYIDEDLPQYFCPTIIQEILQSISNAKQFVQIKESLLVFNILNDNPIEAAIGAASIYRHLRKKGINIGKSNDCLIALYALKKPANIIHKDRDFDLILNNPDTYKP